MSSNEYAERMKAVMRDRQKEDENLMLSLKPVKEKAKKSKKGKGFKTLTAIKLFPGDCILRDINLIAVNVKND